jgi:ABC-type Fe3+-hydroxamate transport system substrate-binding protein
MARLVLEVALLALLVVGCGEADPPVGPRPTATPRLEGGAPPGEVAVLDMALRTVHVPAEVKRVVALSPRRWNTPRRSTWRSWAVRAMRRSPRPPRLPRP